MKYFKPKIISITSNEDLLKFEQLLREEYAKYKGFDNTCEDWLDSEYNQILATYMYPDVTKIQ
jgi:hypothetical protein